MSVFVKHERVWDGFIYAERSGIDKVFRRYLKEKGFHVQQFDETGWDAEWVKCTVSELEKAFADFKEQFYLDEKRRQAVSDEFYIKIRNWYYWTVGTNDKIDSEYALRLVVRLLFCYFLREKELVSEDLFNERFVK